MKNRWPASIELRRWQKLGIAKYLAHPGPDFTLVATPGAGKTRFALRVASELLAMRRIDRVLAVCPTEHLKIQWAEAASLVGIDLDPRWENSSGALASDYDGACVTYAQVAMNPDLHRHHCRVSTFVILDEIHHAGEGKTWGDSIRHAFEPAVRRLSMSGTLFRTDGSGMPFIWFDDSGQLVVDFSCSYPDALSEGCCRPVLFPSYEGEMKWYHRGQPYEATFRDELTERLRAQRLKTALTPNGEWLAQVLRDADQKLNSIRKTHGDAAGLIVAIDKDHAKQVGEVVQRVTGDSPTVVTYDDPDASKAITEFSRGRRPWIVAVKMVSEGVDIPRLRVGVYATNVTSELYFRQFVGRFVRTVAGIEDQNAYAFIPRDEILFGHAQKIAEERQYQLDEACKEAIESAEQGGSGSGMPTDDKILSLFLAVSSTGRADDVVYQEEVFGQDEIREAELLRHEVGAPASLDSAILARLIRKLRVRGGVVEVKAEARVSDPIPTPKHEEKKALRKLVSRLVATLREISDGRLEYSDIYSVLMKRDGCDQEHATIDQLRGRITHMEQWITGYSDGR